jgi:hypothetical protein
VYRALLPRFPDWACVALFYSALHRVEAALSREGAHCVTHQDRELYLKRRHGTVWPAYSRLKNESMKARYLQGGGFSLSAKSVDHELRRGKMAQIRGYLTGLLHPRNSS